jgi:hypothetical protein
MISIHRRAVRRAVLGISFVLGSLALGAGSAEAIQGFGISPASQEVDLNPGETGRGTLTILNDGDSDVTYRMYTTDYGVTGESYQGDFTSRQGEANVSPVTWFSLPGGRVVIKARQQATVSYTLKVPLAATPGGHYAAVFAETIPPPARSGAQVARVERVGSLFYIAVGGELKKQGQILSFELPWLQTLSPLDGTLRMRNDGNVHFATDVKAQLHSPFGKIGKPVLLRGEVLPQTIRRFDLRLPTGSPIGLYRVDVETKFLDKAEKRSQWVVLMPQLTFVIVSSTLLLIFSLLMWRVIRRLKR